MSVLDEVTQLKKRADLLKQQRAEAKGALEQIQRRVKKDFGCNSLEEAEKLLVKKRKQRDEMEKKISAELSRLKKEYPQLWSE